MPPLSVLIKPASSMCNMHCDYCFYYDEAEKRTKKSYGFMSEQTLKNVIRKTISHAEGMISFAYQGGEPTLRGLDFFEKAVAYQKQYNKNHIQIYNSFQTNGYAINEDWCRFFQKNHFLVGLSIDGTQEIHDSLRHTQSGQPTFHAAEQAACLMDAYQVEYNILTVVTSDVAKNINQIYSFYKNRGWNYQQYIACMDPLGERHGLRNYSLSPDLYGKFLIDLFLLWFHDLKAGKQPYIRQFDNYVALAAGYMSESCEQRGICSIQHIVESDGSVYPCDFYVLDDYCLGNFNDNTLQDITETRKKIQFIESSYLLDPKCKSCKYFHLCRGGCQRNRDFYPLENIYRNRFCRSYQIFFDACYEKIMQIGSYIR